MNSPSATGEGVRPAPALIRAAFFLYRRVLSPFLHAAGGASGACRFQPTCSEYAELAIARHGAFRGSLLALRRLAKCHPFHRVEFDPVPPPSVLGAGTARHVK